MIRHVSIIGPGHYLKNRTVEWKREARVEMIRVHASPHDVAELWQRGAPHGHSSFVRCQVAGNDVVFRIGPWERAEISAATQVGGRIDFREPVKGGTTKVWVSSKDEFGRRTVGM